MDTFLSILAALISSFCSIALVLLFIRAIFSWFPGQGGAFADMIYGITEPILYPIRKVFDLFDARPGLPIDISFTVTCLMLIMIKMIFSS